MALTSGVRHGPYEIVSVIGVGGMGEVYRARDTRLRRDVALKVLPELVAGDPERLSRFEREARLLASLNHSNIAQIHGLEESNGIRALAMELVEGPTLAERLERGPLSIADARDVATQIAAAVEAAHEAGVVHRDLKPANIKVRPDGTVKVLDFGLAKASLRAAVGADASATTGTSPGRFGATEPGVVLGTPAYMAPEQARGQEVDKRADIWAFGCIFYEILTGQRLFAGATTSDTIAAVLTREIDLDAISSPVPEHWRDMLRRCLDRDPKSRLRDIGEARVALSQSEPPRLPAASAGSRRRGPTLVAWGATTCLALAVGAFLAYWYLANRSRPNGASTYRFQVATPTMMDLTDFAVSPDGRTLAFVALADEKVPAVWIRPFDAAEASVLPGTEGARGVFWSPDSQAIGYAVSRQLFRRAFNGAAPQVITTLNGQFIGAAWSGDSIVFASFPKGLMRVGASGGEAAALTQLRSGDRLHGRPVFLPDRRLLFPAMTAAGPQICSVTIDRPEMRCVETNGTLVGYVDENHILMLRGGSLVIEPFDVRAMSSTGPGAPAIGDELHLRSSGNRAAVSYSPAGTIAFRPGAAEQRRLVWFDRSGRRGDSSPQAATTTSI